MPHASKIGVEVTTEFLRDHSTPHQKRFAFSYTITIKNHSKEPYRLLKRHWFITDANGQVQEVQGEGVVGEQPLIQPGRSFRYTSGTILRTPVGSMHGLYQMVGPNGAYYDAIIPAFRLAIAALVN
ncbi:MAG TPA: Co2+/Mg2+ efflux protein ApaG [Candidatus Berkiella sp.]|nr:Co2+/Mg2+ efflux protein ApaG [Candidatus Berkiella sp.]